MMEGFFTNLNIQGIWESISLQVNSLFDPERFQFLDTLGFFWDKILDNPLISIITLLVLFGLPYTLFKAKESSNESSERLDLLMDEMKNFEFEKPLIDLHEKFKDISIDNSPVANHDHDVPALNIEKDFPDLSIEKDSIFQDIESASFAKQLTLDQETTDDFLATSSLDLQPKTDNENPELPPLAEENWNETKISPSEETNAEEDKYANQNFEDLSIKNEDRGLVSVTEENFDETEVNPPEPSVEEEEIASPDIDDLQTRMEHAIKKLRLKYPPFEETEESASVEIDTEHVPSVLEGVETPTLHEEPEGDKEEETSHPLSASISPDSPVGEQKYSLKKSHLITHLKSFQRNLENQFDSKTHESGTNSNESPPGVQFLL